MRHHYKVGLRKRCHYATLIDPERYPAVVTRKPAPVGSHAQPDPYAFELLSVVGWEDTGRLIRTVLDHEDAERLRDALTALLSAHVDHGDGHN